VPSTPAVPTPPTRASVAAVASTLDLMDIKQFLSWNLTAVPCVRPPELIRTGTAVLILFVPVWRGKGKIRENPEASCDQAGNTGPIGHKCWC
jgi:hypothetical protein